MKRIVLGHNATGYNAGYGLWVSKPGADAGSSDANDFLVAPGLNNLVSVVSSTFAVGATLALARQGASQRFSIDSYGDYFDATPCFYGAYVTHGLGFVPMVWSDLDVSNLQKYAVPNLGYVVGHPSVYANNLSYYAQLYIDSTVAGVELFGWMITNYNYGGSSNSFTLATSQTLNFAVRLSITNVQVA